jgi:hypothetical protein
VAGRFPIALFLTAAAITSHTGIAAARTTTDLPDDNNGKQVHAVYALPSDGTDRQLDINGTIANEIAAFQTWLGKQTAGAPLRIDKAAGRPDVTFRRFRKSDAQIAATGPLVLSEIEFELNGAGLDEQDKIYAVWYDGGGTYACGGGAYPPFLPGNSAAMYLLGAQAGYPPCSGNPFAAPGGPPGYLQFAMLHEILHTIGIVPNCAPHQVRSGHVSDTPTDLMYAGDELWRPAVLDAGHDDYFDAPIPKCLDLATSGWLAGPDLNSLHLSPRSFKSARKGGSVTVTATGTMIEYLASRPATTTFTVARAAAGRRRGSRCLPPRRRRGGRKCTRWVGVRGSFSHAAGAGANRFGFSGRIGNRALRRGRYKLSAQARNAANVTGQADAARFHIR